MPRSKYDENVLLNNHTCVFGSFYARRLRAWGYSCCHQTVMNSFCTGEGGKRAAAMAEAHAGGAVSGAAAAPLWAQERAAAGAGGAGAGGAGAGAGGAGKPFSKADLFGESLAPELDAEKLKAAMAREAEFKKRGGAPDAAAAAAGGGEGKRKYYSLAQAEVSQEDMEAYRVLRDRGSEDPMAKLLGADDVLPLEDEGRGKKQQRR